ncbi:hypothetical protein [Bacteroides sp.]|uniref:hypothetical protein n=1 Tax=Bacteroides sp. TaxID=29523 RepID=UPI00260CC054|nr:hypothetical protein [Bacteroides sp.]MDD3039014.1 hypothetical protein [Bacteroides sp.]
MLSPDTKTQIFKSLPPKQATRFKFGDNIYSIYKGYTHLTNIEESLKTNHIAILIEYVTEKRAEKESPSNYRFETTYTDNTYTVTWGEIIEGTIRISIYCKESKDFPLDSIMDRFVDRLVEWYICELNDIVPISSRLPVSELKTLKNNIYYRNLDFNIKYQRSFKRTYDTISTIRIHPIELINIDGNIISEDTEDLVFLLEEESNE